MVEGGRTGSKTETVPHANVLTCTCNGRSGAAHHYSSALLHAPPPTPPAAVSACNVAIILFVLAAGLPQANLANLSPLAPFGVRGVFSAASVVFFAFVGFDYVANAAEEARDPAAHLPLGIVLALLIATVCAPQAACCLPTHVWPAAALPLVVPVCDPTASVLCCTYCTTAAVRRCCMWR